VVVASILALVMQQQHVSRTPATVSSMTTALPPKDNQQLPTDLPKGASYPAGVPATGERPGHQTGLSSSRGVRLIQRRD
jgi:hypothetical protein